MFCPNCGAENNEDAQFCGVCGTPLNGFREDENASDVDDQNAESIGMDQSDGRTIFCPDCGAENDEDAQFCGICGTPLNGFREDENASDVNNQNAESVGMDQSDGRTIFCPNCGAENDEDAQFCGVCGTPLGESQERNYDGGNVQGGKKPNGTNKEGFFHSAAGHVLIGFIATCAVIGLVIGIYNIFRSEPESDETKEAEVQKVDENIESVELEEPEEPEGLEESQQDESEVETDSRVEVQVEVEAEDKRTTEENDDYLVPDAAIRYYSTAELSGLSKDQLRIARNEIYARHGRLFDSDDLQEYFNSKSWYNGTIQPNDFDESVLNQYEKSNIDTIKSLEK